MIFDPQGGHDPPKGATTHRLRITELVFLKMAPKVDLLPPSA